MKPLWITLLIIPLLLVGCGQSPSRAPEATPFLSTRVPTLIPPPTITPFSADIMRASNPASFERASGQLQLVELFAFW